MVIVLPALDATQAKTFLIEPLNDAIKPDESTYRVLSSKVRRVVIITASTLADRYQLELKLAKATAVNWTSLLGSGVPSSHVATTSTNEKLQPPKTLPAVEHESSTAKPLPKAKSQRKNWDKLMDEDDDSADSKDPVRSFYTRTALKHCLIIL